MTYIINYAVAGVFFHLPPDYNEFLKRNELIYQCGW